MDNKYLLMALDTYRTEVEGQFGSTSYVEHPITKDAAAEIRKLNTELAAAKNPVIKLHPFDGSAESGMMSQLPWGSIAKLVEKADGGTYSIVALTLKSDGPLIKWDLVEGRQVK